MTTETDHAPITPEPPTDDDLFAQAVELRRAIAPLQDELDTIEAQIKARVLEREAGVVTTYGTAQYKACYQRRTWDGDKLDGYALAHPEMLAMRKESTVRASVAIRYN